MRAFLATTAIILGLACPAWSLPLTTRLDVEIERLTHPSGPSPSASPITVRITISRASGDMDYPL